MYTIHRNTCIPNDVNNLMILIARQKEQNISNEHIINKRLNGTTNVVGQLQEASHPRQPSWRLLGSGALAAPLGSLATFLAVQ